jgi:hypothetical protein
VERAYVPSLPKRDAVPESLREAPVTDETFFDPEKAARVDSDRIIETGQNSNLWAGLWATEELVSLHGWNLSYRKTAKQFRLNASFRMGFAQCNGV